MKMTDVLWSFKICNKKDENKMPCLQLPLPTFNTALLHKTVSPRTEHHRFGGKEKCWRTDHFLVISVENIAPDKIGELFLNGIAIFSVNRGIDRCTVRYYRSLMSYRNGHPKLSLSTSISSVWASRQLVKQSYILPLSFLNLWFFLNLQNKGYASSILAFDSSPESSETDASSYIWFS